MNEHKERVSWNEYEIDEIAKEWVALRLKDPFEYSAELLRQAQAQKLPEHRRRKVATIPPNMRPRIGHFWQVAMEESKKASEPPPPIIIEVEKPRPFDYVEAVTRFDLPTLMAVLMGKMTQEFGGIQGQLENIATRLGQRPQEAPVKQVVVPPLFTPPPRTKHTRVAIVGPLDSQAREIEKCIKEQGIEIEPRFYDKDNRPEIAASVDYCVVTRHSNHGWWDTAQKTLGGSRVFFVDGGISATVQKLRDIASMQKNPISSNGSANGHNGH